MFAILTTNYIHMMNEELLKDIVESNLSADAKVELMKLLLRDKEKIAQPYEVIYPYVIEKRLTPQDWDPYKVTCGESGDSLWLKQHLANAAADCVTNSPVVYN